MMFHIYMNLCEFTRGYLDLFGRVHWEHHLRHCQYIVNTGVGTCWDINMQGDCRTPCEKAGSYCIPQGRYRISSTTRWLIPSYWFWSCWFSSLNDRNRKLHLSHTMAHLWPHWLEVDFNFSGIIRDLKSAKRRWQAEVYPPEMGCLWVGRHFPCQ